MRLQFAQDKSMQGVTDNQIWLQYIMSLGAHGAHKFLSRGLRLSILRCAPACFAPANGDGAGLVSAALAPLPR